MSKLKDPEIIREARELQETRDLYKVPFSCYACKNLMYKWDQKFFFQHGVCSECTTDYILDRELPQELLRDRKALLEHVKQKLSEKGKKQ